MELQRQSIKHRASQKVRQSVLEAADSVKKKSPVVSGLGLESHSPEIHHRFRCCVVDWHLLLDRGRLCYKDAGRSALEAPVVRFDEYAKAIEIREWLCLRIGNGTYGGRRVSVVGWGD